MDDWLGDEPRKRTLSVRDREILHKNANGLCQNCGKKIEFYDMEAGHKQAFSKMGKTTLKNSVCLCHNCNKLQGTDSWAVFLKKQGKQDETDKIRKKLEGRNLQTLKVLAQKYNQKIKGKREENLFETYRKPPSKTQYITALTKKLKENAKTVDELEADITAAQKEKPQIKKKRRRSRSIWSF